MAPQATLQAFLSPQRLRDLAGPKVYARGEDYFTQDKVRLHEHTREEASGEVTGTHPYRVELGLTADGLIADCTCPAMADHGFCKHAVALSLAVINAPPPAAGKKTGPRKAEPDEFSAKYPNIAAWIRDGVVEIGRDGFTTSRIRVMDEGGMVWEGGTRHKSMDAILREADEAIAKWTGEN